MSYYWRGKGAGEMRSTKGDFVAGTLKACVGGMLRLKCRGRSVGQSKKDVYIGTGRIEGLRSKRKVSASEVRRETRPKNQGKKQVLEHPEGLVVNQTHFQTAKPRGNQGSSGRAAKFPAFRDNSRERLGGTMHGRECLFSQTCNHCLTGNRKKALRRRRIWNSTLNRWSNCMVQRGSSLGEP